jgi:hypothetical protein
VSDISRYEAVHLAIRQNKANKPAPKEVQEAIRKQKWSKDLAEMEKRVFVELPVEPVQGELSA